MASLAKSLKEFAATHVDDVDSFLKTWSRFLQGVTGVGAESHACRMQHVEFTALTGVSACVQACNSPALANLALMREGPCNHEAGVVREEVKLPFTHGSFTSKLAAVVTIKKASQGELRQREVAKKVVAENNSRFLAAVSSQGHNFSDVAPAVESLTAFSDGWQDLRYSWYNLVRYVTGDRDAQLQAEKDLSPVDAIIADAESWIDFAVKLNAAFVHKSPDERCAHVSILKTNLCAEVCLSPSLVKLTTFLQAQCPSQYSYVKVADLNVQGMHFGVTVKALEKPHNNLRSLQSQSLPNIPNPFENLLDAYDNLSPVVSNILDDERHLMWATYNGDPSATWNHLSSLVAASVPLLKFGGGQHTFLKAMVARTMHLYMVVSPRQGTDGVCLKLTFEANSLGLAAILLPVSTVVNCGGKVYESRVIAAGDYRLHVDMMTLLDSAITHVAPPSAVESDFDWKAYESGSPQTTRLATRLEPGSWYGLPQERFPDPNLTQYGQQWPMLKDHPETEPIIVEKATGSTTKDRWGDNVQELKTEQSAPSHRSVEFGKVKPGSWYGLPQERFPDPNLTQYGQQWPMLKDHPETEPIIVEKATGSTTKDRWGDNVQELKTEHNVPNQRQLRALSHKDASETSEEKPRKKSEKSDETPEKSDETPKKSEKSDETPEKSEKSDETPKKSDETPDEKPETKADERHQQGGFDYSKYVGGQQGGSPQQGGFDYSKYMGGQQGGSPQQGGFDYSKYMNGGSGFFDYSTGSHGQNSMSWTPQMKTAFDYDSFMDGGSNVSQSAYRQNIEPHFNCKTRDAVLQQFMDEYDHYIHSRKFTHHKKLMVPPPAYQELVHDWVTM
ncbi:MAG: hypothetical protein KVP17_003168 [Porospora cf. gigantea B]|nr:MAG: hypothetical protein KVP17_003168 [Porospora cf. gigantea B]